MQAPQCEPLRALSAGQRLTGWGCAQAISSETGKVIDDFTLKKAANYAPNITARNDFLGSGFQSTYQPSFLEVFRCLC